MLSSFQYGYYYSPTVSYSLIQLLSILSFVYLITCCCHGFFLHYFLHGFTTVFPVADFDMFYLSQGYIKNHLSNLQDVEVCTHHLLHTSLIQLH